MTNEGVIKYDVELTPGTEPPVERIRELEEARSRLHVCRMIGVTPDGIGYGNLSARTANGIYITASATGHLARLSPAHYVRIDDCRPADNYLRATGVYPPSSEAMSHWVVYAADPRVNVVAHVHDPVLFADLRRQGAPETCEHIEYGTPAMATALHQCVRSCSTLPAICVMAGHEDGVIAFGGDVASVVSLLIKTREGVVPNSGEAAEVSCIVRGGEPPREP